MLIKFKKGNYPTTMQAYCDKYLENEYKDIFKKYTLKFYLNSDYDYVYNDDDKFYLNFSSFVILNNGKIKFFAFEDFNDFVWILQIINEDIEFDLDKKVFDKIINDINNFNDRLEITK